MDQLEVKNVKGYFLVLKGNIEPESRLKLEEDLKRKFPNLPFILVEGGSAQLLPIE